MSNKNKTKLQEKIQFTEKIIKQKRNQCLDGWMKLNPAKVDYFTDLENCLYHYEVVSQCGTSPLEQLPLIETKYIDHWSLLYYCIQENNQLYEYSPQQLIQLDLEALSKRYKNKKETHFKQYQEYNEITNNDESTEYDAICPKCKQRNLVSREKQVRSADEPMNEYYMCKNILCRHTFTIKS